VVATVSLPLGDIASWQLRELARIARRFVGDTIRSTVEQNIVLRWVSEGDLPALHAELRRIGLASPGAGTILDVTACPGTDTCKLGIASSRGLAAEISERLAARAQRLDQAIRDLRIKISGCFNSCGQHHLADLGFYGVSRKVRGTTVPHFRIVLGGQSADNAGAYGLTIGAVPSKAVPEFIDRIAERYLGERERAESFQQFAARLGKRELKRMVDELATVPPYEIDASYYSDWRDPREFTTSDIGTGECAGAVVERIDFDLQAAERQSFEAQIHMDEGDHRRADEAAYAAMLDAARGLLNFELHAAPNDADGIVAEFKRHFYDTEIFFDRFAKGKFAQYLLRRHSDTSRVYSADNARHIVEEAQLFIEAAYACHGRLLERRNTETTAAVAFPSIRLRA
jgi:sulfite reductase (ferredoxin)